MNHTTDTQGRSVPFRGLPFCGLVGEPQPGGLGFSVSGEYCLAHLARTKRPSAPGLWGYKNVRGTCSWLGECKGHEWLANCVAVQDVLSQRTLSSRVTCYISWCSEGSSACYRQLVVIVSRASCRL